MATNREIMFLFKARDAAKGVLRNMGTNFKKVGEETRKAAKQATDMERKHKQLRSEIDKLRKSRTQVRKLRDEMTKLKAATTGASRAASRLGGAFGVVGTIGAGFVVRDMLSTFANFDKQMSMVKAVSGATEAELKRLSDTAKELGRTTEFTSAQAAAGLEFLARAGFSADQAIMALPSTLDLATAGALDLARSADIVSNIMSTFEIPISETSRATDVLATVNSNANTNIEQLAEAMKHAGTIAAGFGVNMNETAAAIGVLGNRGLQGSLAGTGIRMALIDAQMLALGNSTRRAQEAFDQLGIDPDKFNPEKVGLIGMIEALKNSGAEMGELVTMFGARAAPSVKAMIDQFDELVDLTRKTYENIGETSRQATDARDNLRDDWRALRSAIEGAYIAITEQLAPALRGAVQFVTSLIQALQGAEVGFEKFKGVAEATASVLTTAFKYAMVVAGFKAIKLIMSGFSAAMAGIGAMAGTASGAMGGLVAAIRLVGVAIRAVPIVGWVVLAVEAIKKLMQVQFKWKGVTISVGDVVRTVWKNTKDWIVSSVVAIKDISAKAWEAMVNKVREWRDGTVQLVTNARTRISEIMATVGQWLSPLVNVFLAVQNVIDGVINGIVGAIVGMVNAIRTILSSLPAVFRNAFSLALNGAVAIMEAGLNTIIDGFRAFLGAIDGAANFLGANLDLAGGVGAISLDGLKVELSPEAENLADDIRKAFNDGQKDYVGAAREQISSLVVTTADTIGSLATSAGEAAVNVITPALDETVASIQNARSDAALIALAQNDGGTVTPIVDPENQPPGGGAGVGSGGGGRNESLKEARDIVGDIVSKNREIIYLSQFQGNELKIQQQRLEAVNQAKQAGVELSAEELQLVRETTQAALDAQAAREMINGYGNLFKETFSSAIKGALDDGRFDMKSFISDFGKRLRDMAIDNFVNIIFQNLGGMFGGGGGGGGGGGILGFLGGMFGFENGGIMTNAGPVPLRRYSEGGIARSPQLAMFGEGSVPEAFVPVPSGRIPVEIRSPQSAQPGGKNVVINMNITTKDADSFRRSQPQIMADMQRELSRQGARNN